MNRTKTYSVTMTAVLFSLGIVLPMLTGQLPEIGSMLLPMHIPVFLAAFLIDLKYSLPMAIFLPLIRSVMFARPNMYPEAIAIAGELATYVIVAGIIYKHLGVQGVVRVYLSLLPAMILGRVVRGLLQATLLGLEGTTFVLSGFLSGVVLYSLPGVVIQLAILPWATEYLSRALEPYRTNHSSIK